MTTLTREPKRGLSLREFAHKKKDRLSLTRLERNHPSDEEFDLRPAFSFLLFDLYLALARSRLTPYTG